MLSNMPIFLEITLNPMTWVRELLGFILNIIFQVLKVVGIENAAITIIVFTLIIKAVMIPMYYRQQKSQKLMGVIQPEINKITNKYKGKKDNASMYKQQDEIQAVYDKYGTSPTSGCLTSLITMLVIFALYRVVYNIHEYIDPINDLLTNVAEAIKNSGVKNYTDILVNYAKDAGATVKYTGSKDTKEIVNVLNSLKPEQWSNFAKEFASSKDCFELIEHNSAELININQFVAGLSIKNVPLDKPWPGVLVPILALITQVYSIHQITKKSAQQQNGQDNPMMQSMMMMNKIMPLFSFFICLSLPIGIGIYWILGSVVQIIQQFFFEKHFDKMDIDQLVKENIERASKKPKKKSYMQKLMDAQKELDGQDQVETLSLKDYAHISSRNYSENVTNDDKRNDGKISTDKKGSIASYANIMKSDKGK